MKKNSLLDIKTEVDLAGRIIAWLRDGGWDVYQEVSIGVYGRRIDIVAVLDRRLWVIECKRRHNFDVIEQAMYWRGVANWVSVASAGRLCATAARRAFHEMLGIGWLHVRHAVDEVDEIVPAPLRRQRVKDFLWDFITPAQRTIGTAGSQSDYYSSFRETRKRVQRLIAQKPGITMKEIVAEGESYHYSSSSTARASLAKWIANGVIPGIESRHDGRRYRYYPAAAATEPGQERSPT